MTVEPNRRWRRRRRRWLSRIKGGERSKGKEGRDGGDEADLRRMWRTSCGFGSPEERETAVAKTAVASTAVAATAEVDCDRR
ncbi:unnamed protein product [Arabidopsis lyrata]|uniref:Predicted protein n=1 Tax=Arabidopsis lyrata subsp. lyrata TaxID=81972 RepID=D7KUF1_ARALL|nr:predicted protein [Arabidopsis lyrata subsp. lyrata]CAH8257274.1 unnamed protein product [Arabidopsis lyrata]